MGVASLVLNCRPMGPAFSNEINGGGGFGLGDFAVAGTTSAKVVPILNSSIVIWQATPVRMPAYPELKGKLWSAAKPVKYSSLPLVGSVVWLSQTSSRSLPKKAVV